MYQIISLLNNARIIQELGMQLNQTVKNYITSYFLARLLCNM